MKRFKTHRNENIKSKLDRLRFNLFPAIRGTGVWVSFISEYWNEIHVRLPLSWRTRNYVGTIFGGSIYASVDPFYMLQFMKLLGKKYIVWDKSAEVFFKRPIDKTVYAKFIITDKMVEDVKNEVAKNNKMNIDIQVDFVDKSGVIYAEIVKTIYIADKNYYKSKRNEISTISS